MFSEGKFPSILKGEIFPVHKKCCKTEVTNYRPISLFSNISKIIKQRSNALTEVTEQIRVLVTKVISLAESTLIYKKHLIQ